MKILQKAQYLRELVEELDLHGLYFQHVALCRRRAWLHLIGATHANRDPRVRRGLALHASDQRSNDIQWGLGIVPDEMDFERRVVIEKKGGSGARDAVSRQALFYAAYMTAATSEVWSAELHVYGSRKGRTLGLTESVLDQLIADAQHSRTLMAGPCPPARRIGLCEACSCQQLCWDEESNWTS